MALISQSIGNLATPTEVDSYAVDLVAGTHYSFDITGQTALNSVFSLGNPVVKLYAPDGTLVGQQDYSMVSTGMGGNASLLCLDPHFAFTAGSSGQYTITVESGQIAEFAYDWDSYLPNSGQTLNNLNITGTYQLAINTYSNTELIDPVIGNYRWMDHSGDARGSGVTIYYDFATNNLGSSTTTAKNPAYGWHNIQGFNVADQAKIEGWLAEFEAVANINFVRADANHTATIHFMLGKAADGSTGTAWLYAKQGGYQFNAGDYATDKELGRVDLLIDSDSWTEQGITSGSAYALFMHEMGHALGLKHPGNYFGESTTRVENAAYDNSAWSLLSYNDSYQQGFATEGTALKGLDIAALQTIYGLNPNSPAANSTWRFNDTHAEYATTIHDSGGIDTLDASGQSIGSVINLQPGSLSSIGNVAVPAGMEAVLAQYMVEGVFGDKAYNNVGIAFDTLIENAKGGAGADVIAGNALANVLTGNGGDDHLDGGLGFDTAIYSGQYGQYQIDMTSGQVSDTVALRDGTDTLSDIERVQFSDKTVGLDVGAEQSTGEVYRLYLTVLGRNPEADAVGCGFWIDKLDNGILNTEQMVGYFLESAEFTARFGATTSTNDSFVNLMYLNLLGRDGHPDSGFNFWLSVLDNQYASREQVVAAFMESPENVANAAPLIGDAPTFQQWIG